MPNEIIPGAALGPDATARAMVSNPRWAARLGWTSYVAAICVLLKGAGTRAPGDAELAEWVARWQRERGLEVDGIIGPDTWAALKIALSPPTSPTGIVPPAAPGIPGSFAEVLSAFGDPRELMNPDGTISDENNQRWQREILGRGKLPFPIPLDPKNPAAGTKTTFYAHHKLVGIFEAVFHEIDRLGLRPAIRSWGGIYNFRAIRQASNLSLHAFGVAIDLNSETNQLSTPGDMDAGVVEVFEHFGFLWGGKFRGRTDPMHFQYARGH